MKSFVFKFCVLFVLVLSPFSYYYIFVEPSQYGDLCKLGKFKGDEAYHMKMSSAARSSHYFDIPADSIAGLKEQEYILTIGDSFSALGESGYQNILASLITNKVYNISDTQSTPIAMAVALLKSGLIDGHDVKCVIVECVERNLVERLAAIDTSLSWQTTVSIENAQELQTHSKEPIFEVCSWLRLLFQVNNPVKHSKLNDAFFSAPHKERDLRFYMGDLSFQGIQAEDVEATLSKLIEIKSLFDSRGIRLIFMVAADKYDVYSPYIVNNPYPMNTLLEHFSGLDPSFFVNTKAVLAPYVDSGVLDLYHWGDSHWSSIGSRIVSNHLLSIIEP